jgi:hypothetical protein
MVEMFDSGKNGFKHTYTLQQENCCSSEDSQEHSEVE